MAENSFVLDPFEEAKLFDKAASPVYHFTLQGKARLMTAVSDMKDLKPCILM